jgi:hypothetical protein
MSELLVALAMALAFEAPTAKAKPGQQGIERSTPAKAAQVAPLKCAPAQKPQERCARPASVPVAGS